VTIATVDDYSLFYYSKQNFLFSDLRMAHVQVGPVTINEVRSYLETSLVEARASSEYTHAIADVVMTESGGHIGLAQEILNGLRYKNWPNLGPEVMSCVATALKNSFVLESISQALEEDAEGYARTATEYRIPSRPELNSPR